MVGNKHKNGIICTFPGCEKPMRTQKFKLHFTKAHLKQGELYSVEHRRRFEVAREDGDSSRSDPSTGAARGGPKLEAAGAAATAATTVAPIAVEVGVAPRMELVSVPLAPVAAAPAAGEHKELQGSRTGPTQAVHLPPQIEIPLVSAAVSREASASVAASNPASLLPQVATQNVSEKPTSVPIPMPSASSEHNSNNKRSAAAMDAPAEGMDPSSALLVEFVALMDRRFQELVGKMGEMIEVQKELIDALQGKNPSVLSNQTPGLALASAAEVVMKKRKKDANLDETLSIGSGNGTGDIALKVMAREVWFQLVDGEGKLVPSADCIDCADDAKVFCLCDAVKEKFNDSHLAGIAPSDLNVFANRAAFDTKQALDPRAPLAGNDENETLIVQVPQRTASVPSYFILPETREKVAKAVFVIVEEDRDRAGIRLGVFFSPTLAVTCAHNLTEQQRVGSLVYLALKEEMANVEVVARNSELDFAILKSSEPRSFIAPWSGSPDDLESRCDLVLASFRLGIDEYRAPYSGKLGFAPAACISISRRKRHLVYSCPTYAGDSGAALIVKDGYLVGIHLETINALRENLDRKKIIKDRLNDVEESLDNIVRSGLAQGCSGLLVHEFKKVVSDEQAVEAFGSVEQTLAAVEEHLAVFKHTSMEDFVAPLSPLERAKVQVSLAYTVNALLFVFLKTQGVSTKDIRQTHVKQELVRCDRVKAFIKKIKDAEELAKGPKLVLDKAASKRFVHKALSSDQVYVDAVNAKKEGQDEAATAVSADQKGGKGETKAKRPAPKAAGKKNKRQRK
ncbi:hypothetical protein BBJ28_00016351 [Nothophytophthora sp. Chile5]|nr:hypothetical protein BBJ28_00016351 [Nothophytophthora sp. Chile5]